MLFPRRSRGGAPGAPGTWQVRRRLPLVASGALLAGCAAITTVGAGVDPSAGRPRAVPDTGLFDWKGIVHCHCRLSHDSDGTHEEILAACRESAIDFVVMTDHQTEQSIRDGVRGLVGDTLFVVGGEVRCPQGTLIAFPLQRPLRRWQHPGLIAREAAEQGAIALVCHAESWRIDWNVLGLVGAEIVNLHAGATTAGAAGTLATALFLPLRSLLERICVRDERVFAAWDRQLAEVHPFTPVGGDDAHANVRVFGPLGGTIGTYREVFATLSTHVLAERLDEAALVEALRLGRTYVSFDIFGDGAGFDFRAVADGAVHVGGATVPAGPGLELRVSTPRAGRIRLLRDGVVAREVEGDALSLAAPDPGVWRVEVATRGGDPWLFSSSIRVAPAVGRPAPGDLAAVATWRCVP